MTVLMKELKENKEIEEVEVAEAVVEVALKVEEEVAMKVEDEVALEVEVVREDPVEVVTITTDQHIKHQLLFQDYTIPLKRNSKLLHKI